MNEYEKMYRDIAGAVESAKRDLAERILTSLEDADETRAVISGEDIAKAGAQIATMSGESRVYHLVWKLQKRGDVDREGVVRELLRLVSRGPDDTWSGRANDVRRAYHDGVRRGVQYAMLNGV